MSSIERSAYTVALEIGRPDAVIRAMLFPATGGEGEGYKQRVWRDIMRSLSEANKRVEQELVHILTRAVHQHDHQTEIEEKLGPSVTGRIYQLVAARELPESYDSAPLTERRLAGVWASRTRLLGAYAFAAGVLCRLGAAASVDCPVCYDTVDDFFVAQCGHFVCRDCMPQLRGCPLCRTQDAVWRSGLALRQELAASQDAAPAEEERQTSGKFYELARILHELGETERVLVVSPLRNMLDDVCKEMGKLGVALAILRGGTVEQQNTLKAWQAGGFKGLLSDPDIPALNLSEASTVVFLSPALTDTQFVQATGRVVRQGSLHRRVRVVVLAAAQSAETDDAARVERFRAIAHDMSQGKIHEPA
jgi:SNF2 family DNA or RNA helicase